MPRYYCDYCDTYLTHDSPSVRKQHNGGYKHKANVRTYYQQFEQQQTQSLIDQRIKEHLSGQAAFGMGAPFAAWRPGMPGMPGMPGIRPPILPAPLPIPGQMLPNAPMAPIPRLAVMPRPMGAPVYGNAPAPAQPGAPGAPMHAPMPAQSGAPGAPMPQNGLPGPPPMTAPTSASGSTVSGSNGAPPGQPQPGFQNPGTSGNFSGGNSMPAMSSFPSSGGNAPYPTTSGTDSYSYARPPN